MNKGFYSAAVSMICFGLANTTMVCGADFIFEARQLPKGRAFHGSAVLGDYLYVFGGASTTTPSDVENKRGLEEQDRTILKAGILPGGGLADWEEIAPLPKDMNYIGSSTVTLNDVVYIVGGSSLPANGTYYDTAIWSKPLPDGSLMPWRESRPFGERLAIMTAITTPDHIHIIGGLADTEQSTPDKRLPSSRVYSNRVFADGTMGDWELGPELPVGVWYHSAGVVAGRVYVWGGLHLSTVSVESASSDIYSCAILSSGKLGPWRKEKSHLMMGMYSAGSAVAGPYLLSFSPRYPRIGTATDGSQSQHSSDVCWSSSSPFGLSPWTKIESNIPNRLYHSVTPDYRRGNIYVIGGRPKRSDDYTPTVQCFVLSPAARSAAENQWSNSESMIQESVSTFEIYDNQDHKTGEIQGRQQLSYLAESKVSSVAPKGFLTISNARRLANDPNNKIPLVMYFNSPDAIPCIEQLEILQKPVMEVATQRAAFAWVDSGEYPQLAQQLGVYRVPTWIFFGRNGEEVKRYTQILPLSEIISVTTNLP
ncbi:MAG: thioredoxin family protein [Candidatus Sumerlaeia bacterium]|nr:thioredoxin family protein [Candidatus Sumerlaeia bacterium]